MGPSFGTERHARHRPVARTAAPDPTASGPSHTDTRIRSMMKSLGICSRLRRCRVAAVFCLAFPAFVGGLTPTVALLAAGEGDSSTVLEGPPQVVVEATSLV